MIADRRSTLVAVFGTPSCLTYWGIHVVRTIIGTIDKDYQLVHGHHLSEFTEVHANRASQHSAICVSDCPEVDVCKLFMASNTPIVVFVEQPLNVIEDLVCSGIDHISALRLATRSLCAIQPLFRAPSATIFRMESFDSDLRTVTEAILKTLGFTPTDEQRETIDLLLASSRERLILPVRDHVSRLIPNFTKRGEPIPQNPLAAIAIAEPYACLVTGEALTTVEWPASIFSSGDAIGDYVGGPNDLVGPARILVYGPYMHLPRGDWSAYIELEVSENESGNRLKVDVVCGPFISASVIADMPSEGRYRLDIPFEVIEPLQPVELRFQIESGAIEGRFLLTKVVMTAVQVEAVASSKLIVSPA